MKMLQNGLQTLAVTIAILQSQIGTADEVYVAVATNFATTVKTIAAEFEEQSEHRIILSFGSSGKLFAQIVNGAPFEVFLSADTAKPDALERRGLVSARRTYAQGKLAIWLREPSDLPWQAQLKQPEVRKIALAHPKLAPYGTAALQTLRRLDLELATRDKWVRGENIAQTFQFVRSGNADAGFIAWSQARSIPQDTGEVRLVAAKHHLPIHQDAVLLQRGEGNSGARSFFEFLATQAALKIIAADGYFVEAPVARVLVKDRD